MDNVVVGDTDPVNTTTAKVKRLNADLIQITENSKVVNLNSIQCSNQC